MSTCLVCNLTVNSPEQLQQHMKGKAHKKKMMAAGVSEEGPTSAAAVGAVSQGQEVSLPDSSNGVPPTQVLQGDSLTGTNGSGSVKKRKSTEGAEAGMCSLCNIVFNSTVQAQQHYSGSKHFKRMKIVHGNVEKTQEDGSGEAVSTKTSGMLYCGFCKIQVNSQEQLDKHREGAKHKKNLEKLKTVAPIKKGKATPDPTAVKESDIPMTLPSFETYLSTTFVKAKDQTKSSMPSLDSYLKS
ncbi:zinc finger protein 346-like isoform X1 [Haliotis rufescens]|uniref:zinc finger protein 346-like isoform X1 n=1 Tax=Haliotis rufescens TaxID=6454 RepID=UPI001EAFBEED|nr:zinc finger protein 346-like isoform X1 [Haliotis rufescens]